MPIVKSLYKPSLVFRNGHISTLYSALVRKVPGIHYSRERISLPDGDFLDLDWSYSKQKTHQLLILVHGLEGTASRPYILGSAKLFNQYNYDCCSINLRGCSGEINTLYRSYHSGASDDLNEVIQHILNHYEYTSIIIKGFSLGGNIALKYLGETTNVPKQIKAAIAVSVPCSLYGAMVELHRPKNFLYTYNFRYHLVHKLKIKQQYFPDKISDDDIKRIKTLKDFDDTYTSKANGFVDALDYYSQCSSKQFLKNITIPTFILNAKNDSFLSEECYPKIEAETNKNLFLEMPNFGGHVGFIDTENVYYNEQRALWFIDELL